MDPLEHCGVRGRRVAGGRITAAEAPKGGHVCIVSLVRLMPWEKEAADASFPGSWVRSSEGPTVISLSLSRKRR